MKKITTLLMGMLLICNSMQATVVQDRYAYPERSEGKYSLTNTWIFSNVEDNFVANQPANNDFARGMAAKDGKMYFINRETRSITVVDGATGEMLEPIFITGSDTLFYVQDENGEWTQGCLLPYNDIKFDDAGNCLIGACVTGLSQTFFVYLVDLETGEATEIVKETLGDNPEFVNSINYSIRLDAFGVTGDVTKDGVIMAADMGSWNVYRWLIKGGKAQKAGRIDCSIDINSDNSLSGKEYYFNTAPQIFPQDEKGELFYVDGHSTYPMLFDKDGHLKGDFISCPSGLQIVNTEGDTCKLSKAPNGLCDFKVGNERFLVMAASNNLDGEAPFSFALYKFGDKDRSYESLEPLWYFPANGMGTTINGCRVAMPCVEVVDNKAYIYLYVNNNGYARYELEVEDVQYDYTIRVHKSDMSSMDTSNGLYLWWWITSTDGKIATMELGEDGWYSTTITSPSPMINCLAVNQNVELDSWDGSQQTVDFDNVTGDICLEIGEIETYNKYAIYETSCEEEEEDEIVVSNYHDFEDATINTQWRFAQDGQANYWTIGSAAGSADGGSNALYITSDGENYSYDNEQESTSWAYIPVSLTGNNNITFSWKGVAESCCDYLNVYLLPRDVTPQAGVQYVEDAIILQSTLNEQESWQQASEYALFTGEYNLCFMWHNDFSVGAGPIAIDNISIEEVPVLTSYPLTYVLNDDGTASVTSCDKDYSGEINIPSTVTYEGTIYNVVEIEKDAFEECVNVTKVSIANSVTSIGERAFIDCRNLAEIVLPNQLTSIESGTFLGCHSLTSITLPNSVTSIGIQAFYYCTSLQSIDMGDGLLYIMGDAFNNCTSLQSLQIPASVNYIEGYAFYNCTALTSIEVESGNSIYDSRYGCNAIVMSATNKLIFGCSTTIIPHDVTTIGNKAFYHCNGLVEIFIPGNVTHIESDAFAYCQNLASVTLASGIEQIESGAFYGCKSLQTIRIPESVTNIGYDAFEHCPNIVMEGTTPPQIDVSTFSSEATIWVPCSAVETYQAAEYWQDLNIQGQSDGYTISLSATEGGSAQVTASDCATNGVTIEAYPENGYQFTQWSDGNTDNPRTLTLTENIELTAEFSPLSYAITNLEVTADCGTLLATWESDAPYFEIHIYDSNNTLRASATQWESKSAYLSNMEEGTYTWYIRPLNENLEPLAEYISQTVTMILDGCIDYQIYDLQHTITQDSIVNITWQSESPLYQIQVYDYNGNMLYSHILSGNQFCDTLSEIGRYNVQMRSVDADTMHYKSDTYYLAIDINYGDWTYDLNFTRLVQSNFGVWQDGSYNRPIYLYSADGKTTMSMQIFTKHENSIIGTYTTASDDELQMGKMSYLVYLCYKGIPINEYAQYCIATITRDTQDNLVVDFEFANQEGELYTNTCTITDASGENIHENGVTAMSASQALTWTQNLTHTDETAMPFLVEGVISQITSSSSDMVMYGNAHMYISEDGSSNNQFYCYSTKWLDNTNFTTGNEIAVGDTVVIYGNLQNYNGTTPEIKGYVYQHKEKVQPEGEDPVLDINFTHGKVIRYSNSNQELHLSSADENTQIVFDLYSEYNNSILGTYIVSNSDNVGDCYTYFSQISFAETPVNLSSGVVTVIKDAIGNFVISFDVVDQNGNAYANTCTIASSLITLEDNADISGTGVTALTAVEGKTTTQNLTHTDETAVPYLVKGVISQITSYDVTRYTRARFYISDDGSSTDEFYCYNIQWLNNTNFTTGEEIAVGDTVVIYGNLQNYNGTTPEIKGYVYQSIKPANFYYTLSVTADEGGTVDVNPLLETYPEGTTVSLSAIADTGYEFVSWSDGNTDRIRTVVMTGDVTLHAIFRSVDDPVNYYTLTVTAGEGGIVTKSPDQESYADGAVVTITAIANAGYEFVSWSDGNTAAERAIVMTSDVTLQASFRLAEEPENYYTLTLMAGEGGTVTKSPEQDSYAEGDVVIITAIADTGYEFVSWSDGNTKEERTIVMLQDYEFTAHFIAVTPCYQLNVAADEGGRVVVSPQQDCYESGTSVSVAAFANNGYQFTQWSDGNTDNPRTIVVEQDMDLSAEFQPIYHMLTIEESIGGQVTADPYYDQYIEGQEVVVTATPDNGYEFVCWSDGVRANPRTLTMDKDYIISATFRSTDIPENNYTLTLTHSTGGYVTRDPAKDYYESGERVYIEAIAHDGYIFQGWSDGSTETLRGISITQDTIIHASFVPAIQYTLTLTSSEGGTVMKDPDQATYNEGDNVRIIAIPDDGFEFQKWSDGNTDAERLIQMDKDYTLKAYFKRMASDMDITNLKLTSSNLRLTASWTSAATRFDITITNSNEEEVKSDKVTIEEANKVYRYTVPKAGKYTVTVTPLDMNDKQNGIAASAERTLVRKYSLNITADYGGTVNEDVNGSYEKGETVEIIATPNNGYRFSSWSDGDTNAKRTLTMDQDYDLTAQFTRIPTYTLTIFQGEHGVASMEAGTYTYQEKEQVTLTATPDEGYMFDHWVVNGEEDANAELTLTMTQNYDVYPVCVSKPIPTYTLTILPSEFGKADIGIGTYTYNEGDEVTLLPIADKNYLFDQWMVNGEAKADSVLVLVMDKDYEVMPTFKPNTVGVENLYNGVTVRIQENMIIVEASHEQDIMLYDLVGHLVGSAQKSREAYFTVPSAGLYMLRTNNGIQKIRIE